MDVSKLRLYCVILLLFIFDVMYGSANESSMESETTQESMKKLATANNHFGLNLYRVMSRENSGNIIFSPLSLSAAFGMLFYGTRGRTAQELRNVLGYNSANISNALVPSTFNRFLTENLPANNTENPEYILNVANAMVVDKHFHFYSCYKSRVQKLYQAAVQEVDFENDGNSVVDQINSWVNEKTNNQIPNLLSGLDSSTKMVLLNAVYFKGTWFTKFPKGQTSSKMFYNNGETSDAKEVQFMHMKAKFSYTQIYGFKAVELPYKGKNISMIILLPNRQDGLSTLERRLTTKRMSEIRARLSKKTVEIWLPKFKIRYGKELSYTLKRLGARSLFDEKLANFAGMTNQRDLAVTEVIHKAVVEVDEEGSEAAAATAISVVRIRTGVPSPERVEIFKADHPFFFAIIDKRNGMILFAGRINKM